MFSDTRVGVKLGASFLIMVLLSAIMGGASLLQMYRINGNTQDMAKLWIPSIKHLDAMQGMLNVMRRAELQHVMATSAEEKKPELERIVAAMAKLEEALRKAQSLMKNPTEQALLAEYEAGLKSYYSTSTKLLALSDIGPAEAVAAMDYLNGASKSAFAKVLGTIEKLIESNSKGVDDAFDGAESTFATSIASIVALVTVSVGLAIVLGVLIVRTITRPLAHAMRVTQSFTAGDLTHEIQHQGSDEPSQMLHALESMRQGLSRVVSHVRLCSDNVASASAEIAHGNHDLSNRTEHQASNLQATASSMDELGTTVRQNAENAMEANQLALNASNVAARGGDAVNQVVSTMRDINMASGKIADIISVIDGIAFQTNILALNAAVEAARAGDQGRGFAVVASEVRTLAGRSAEAAKEIKALISASVQTVERGTALVDQAGSTMVEVVASIRRVTEIVGQISAASSEQANGVAQVTESVSLMDQATQQNAALVEQMAAAASSLRSQANELVGVVSSFSLSPKFQPALLR